MPAGVVQERRKASRTSESSDRMWGVFLLVVTLVLVAGYFAVSPQKFYKPGDDVGYNLGLAGGIMLLSLLLYPLRKRFVVFRSFGLLPGWFRWHMVLGILAPTLIMFHATFHIASMNAGVALISMLLVSGSGTFGRFFYTKIHHGLYGRQASVNEIKERLEPNGDVKSIFNFAPEVEKKILQFRENSELNAQAGKLGLVKFFVIAWQTKKLTNVLIKELRVLMLKQAEEQKYTAAQLIRMEVMYAGYVSLISSYLKAIRDTSQFHTYERLFSYWHLFHIPLVYMMVFSGIYHVIAVHMY